MILFCGIPSELPLALAIAAAEAAELPYVVFNQLEASFSDLLLEQRDGRWSGTLWVQETAWPLEDFTGVYTRAIDYGSLPANRAQARRQPDPQAVAHSAFLHSALADWIELAECRVLNKTEAMASNGSKPYQAQWIQRAGFLTPPTLVTNEPAEALDFARRHGRVIYKSTSSIRSIVREFDPRRCDELSRLHSLPTQFQARISGTNIRVHVVGQELFATEIASTAVDYRYAHRDGEQVEMRVVELPDDTAARCVRLSQALRLPFCGIDIMRTPADQYYCFEVNPSPAYSYYEQETGQPIARAVVDFLAGENETSMSNVKVIENWADVTGRLLAFRPHPELTGYVIATLAVSAVKTVPGFANLLEFAKGQTIEVNVAAARSAELERAIGTEVSWRVCKAGPSSIFAHPDLRVP
jgi:RimK-like ATP-grasp domain